MYEHLIKSPVKIANEINKRPGAYSKQYGIPFTMDVQLIPIELTSI